MPKTIRTGAELLARGLIASSAKSEIDSVAQRYAVAITEAVLDTMEAGNPDDPIARQYVPNIAELQQAEHEQSDPIGDAAHTPVTGLIHRYPDRVLLKPTSVCPVYCRFCFRREMVGHNATAPLTDAQLDDAFAYIAAQPQIWEVIVSGGDPLAMSPRRLADLIERLRPLDHVRVLRFHSRVPVVDPARLTPELVQVLAGAAQTTYVLVHANHANELTEAAKAACARLLDAGITLLSQTVLLKGVNDRIEVLVALMRAFVETRIVPYYLHHPDLAPGTSHFRLSIEAGRRLLQALRGHYSGLCQPDYVIDIPGGYGKSPLTMEYVRQDTTRPDHYRITDFTGAEHDYTDPN